jgi:hypothetical protein
MNPTEDIQPLKKRSIESVKPLDANGLNQQLWLVKLPAFVAEQWSSAKHDDVLGTFMIGMVPPKNGKPASKQLMVKLKPGAGENGVSKGPDSFTLDEIGANAVSSSKDAGLTDSMVAFSNDAKAEEFSINGKITKSLVLRPQHNSDYSNLVHDRSLQKLANRREVKTANFESLQKAADQNYTVEFITSSKVDMKVKIGEDLDRSTLKSKIFEAFEKSQLLSLKEIIDYCKGVKGFSNEKDLKLLLKDYAVYNTHSINRGFYQLKSEYHSKLLTSTSSSTSNSTSNNNSNSNSNAAASSLLSSSSANATATD